MKPQPIETAPKDGTIILVFNDNQWIFASWSKASHVPLYGFTDYHAHHDPENVSLIRPTHWAPLPEYPETNS